MRRRMIILIGILMLAGIIFGSYWYFQLHTPNDLMPESGIFVMEDPPCRHYI